MLDLDIGNTRAKWRIWREGLIHASGTCSQQDLVAGRWPGGGPPDQVRVASVLGPDGMAELLTTMEAAGIPCTFVRTTAELATRHGPLLNGYQQPERLGVDRWLAMAGARDRWDGALVVVDSGTALTLDLVAGGGAHGGGYIVPGTVLAAESLLAGTAGVRPPRTGATDTAPGTDTATAVWHGIHRMHADFVAGVARRNAAAQLVLTGGGAPVLAEHLAANGLAGEHVPDLVLDGLEVACRA